MGSAKSKTSPCASPLLPENHVAVDPYVEWPCANCHSMVSSEETRCRVCRGIQVKILLSPSDTEGSSSTKFIYLERVESPVRDATSPFVLQKRAPPPPVTTDKSTSSHDADALEASPKHDIIHESDDLRPVDPVAVTLANVPSPAPPMMPIDEDDSSKSDLDKKRPASSPHNNSSWAKQLPKIKKQKT